MKLYNILFEAFVIEPRNLNLFITKLIEQIKLREAKLNRLAKELEFVSDDQSDKEDKEYYFNKVLNMGTDYKHDSEHVQYLLNTVRKALKPYNEHITDNIENLYSLAKSTKNGHDRWNMLSYILKALERLNEDLEESVSYAQDFVNADFAEGLEAYSEFFETDPTLAVKEIAAEYIDFKKYIQEYIIPKMERLMQRRYAQTDKDMAHKNIERAETLYHATANAPEIFKNGFKTNFDQASEGIGGSNLDKGGKPAISFTADLYVAKEIARCLKEAIMIAKGELDIYDVKTMALQEGTHKQIVDTMPFYGKEENLEGLEPKEVFEYYRLYLMYSPTRYDPLFFDSRGLMNIFKTKNVEDVGVLVCKVDMTDPNILYLSSMEEFRVSPKNVISIEKILR